MEREFKIDLSNLTKIPAKEFEKHFRDWMERDDVARALQAKLRSDLIINFNKTSLGKQILAQTTTTTTGGYGGSTQRLTLSPLTLALSTLVAEFLYAQNCHFSLSVFCTEVPFRNTLPDFESARFFRFTEVEIDDIIEAISGTSKNLKAAKNQITKKYTESNTASLLLLILKALLEKVKETPKKPADTAENNASLPQEELPGDAAEDKAARHDYKTEVYNTNFRYLNKYLIILSKKVKEMTQQFENLQQMQHSARATATAGSKIPSRMRFGKSLRTRRYDNLNRSLERVTENLKQMTHAKRKSKHVAAIVNAIDSLAVQFSKCAANFENVSRGVVPKRSQEKVNVEKINVEKQTETDMPEKTYTDWVHEMRHTTNGQKFLDRIEVSLRKALNKQKIMLQRETDVKLRHQRELMKIRYKEKLLVQSSRHVLSDQPYESRKIHENIQQQLRKFEAKHAELLNKISDVEISIKDQPRKEDLVEKVVELIKEKETERPSSPSIKAKSLPSLNPQSPVMKDAINTQRQIQAVFKSLAEQERNVDQIVLDARSRLQELEKESNQLEQSFVNYLERQKLQRTLSCKRITRSHTYADLSGKTAAAIVRGRKRTRPPQFKRYRDTRSPNHSDNATEKEEEEENILKVALQMGINEVVKSTERRISTSDEQELSSFEFRNPIVEAKQRFFEAGEKFKRNATRALDMARDEAAAFYHNEEFGRTESKDNLESLPQVIEAKSCTAFAQQREQKRSHSKVRRKSTMRSSSTSSSHAPSARDVHKCKRQLFATKEDITIPSARVIRMIVDKDNTVHTEDVNKVPPAELNEKRDQHAAVVSKRKPAPVGGKVNVSKAKQSAAKSSTSTVLQQSMEKMQQLFTQPQPQRSKETLEKTIQTEEASTNTCRQSCDVAVSVSEVDTSEIVHAALAPRDNSREHKSGANNNQQQEGNVAEAKIPIEVIKTPITRATIVQQTMELKAVLDTSVSSTKSAKAALTLAAMAAETFAFQDVVTTTATTTPATTGRTQIESGDEATARPVGEATRGAAKGSTAESLEMGEAEEQRNISGAGIFVPPIDVGATTSSSTSISIELQLSTGHAGSKESDDSDFWR